MAIPFQIPAGMISGVPGEVAFDGPTRAVPSIEDSGAVPFVIGRAATYKNAAVDSVQAGGTGAFAGIIIHPKAYAVDTATQQDGEQCELLTMGEVYVQLATTGAVIGSPIFFTNATGVLSHGTAAAGQTQIPNCVVSRHNVSVATPTLAVIKLTN